MTLDDLWVDLRQGARNVAGVTWQVAVSVHLLVLARAGDLPFAFVTPEGFEDLDCIGADETQTFVQMKETAAGEGRLTASDIGDALKHAEDAARGARIVLVTDGQLGSGLGFTGWHSFVSGQPAAAVNNVVEALKRRGVDGPAAWDIVARSGLVRLPWRLRDLTEQRLADTLGAHPTVASFAVDVLCAAVAASAADQRAVERSHARTHAVADVDAAVAQVQSAVDVAGLDAAVAAGVCAPADFLVGSVLTAGEFYAGVDGSPAHIAARLDVPRPGEIDAIRSAAQQERYALIVGPSGSGKSVLLWRVARDVVPGARVVRVRRLRTPAEADTLIRHVRLLRPSLAAPVVVAADDLGRPGMAAWPDAVGELREATGVVLIGACRAEDFRPSLVVGPTRVVEPVLDDATAQAVADRVEAAGVPLAMTADEAAARSGGLFMEFLALLTTGTRLEQVLAAQADGLRQPGRELQREVARLLTAAHSLGLALEADRLGWALAGEDSSKVGDALSVLQNEHVVIHDGSSWTGLHELRSRTLATLLHESPPPTLAATFARTVALLDPPEAGWLLRRVTEQDPADLPAATLAAAQAVARDGVTADDAAVLLEGAERADNAVYARICKPILVQALRPGMTVHQLALMAYGVRNQGLVYPRTGSPQIDGPLKAVEAIGRSLPTRSATTAAAVAAGITPERLSALVLSADLPSVVRLLEAGAGLLPVTAQLAQLLLDAHRGPNAPEQAELWPRLVEALYNALPEHKRPEALGPVEHRALRVAQADPLAIGLTVAPSESEVTLTLLLPPCAAPPNTPIWDSVAPSGHEDLANGMAVAAARRLAAACRELTIVEIITVTPSGRRYRIADHEPGYKRMPTATALLDRTGVRRSVGFQSALRRLTAAGSWTAVLRQQIEVGTELADLVAEAPARLSSRDNQGRRRTWTARAAAAVVAVGQLAGRPASTGVDPSVSHARADDEQRRADLASDALADLAKALPRIIEDGLRPLHLASTLWDATDRLAAASTAAAPTLTGLGSPIPDRLVRDCRRLTRALAALDQDPSGAERIRTADPLESADRLAAAAAEKSAARERTLLDDHLLGVADAVIHRVQDPSPPSWTTDATAWVITVPAGRWDDLCHALAEIHADTKRELGGRVFAAACDGQTVLLTTRLTSFEDQALLPLTPDAARPLVEAAGLVLAQGPATSMSQLVDNLVHLSWQTARDRARPHDWPPVERDPALSLKTLEFDAEAACAWLQEPDGHTLRTALAILLNQVESELGSPQQTTLAGVVFDTFDLATQPGEVAELWAALTCLAHSGLVSPSQL